MHLHWGEGRLYLPSQREAACDLKNAAGQLIMEWKMSQLEKVSPAVRKETKNITIYTAVGTAGMLMVFFLLHRIYPEKVPFDFTVVSAGLLGALVAVLNFFLMGLAVQKVASTSDEQLARGYMKASYSRRMLMQMLWAVLAICLPCFHFAAGLIPLLFPSLGIKIIGTLKGIGVIHHS